MPRRLPVVNYDDKNLCQSCGACCGPSCAQLGWPDVSPKDIQWMDEDEANEKLTTEPGFLAFETVMSKQGYVVCPFLKGTIGREVACSIYSKRPESCRAFEAGSNECKSFRRLRADAILAGIDERAAKSK